MFVTVSTVSANAAAPFKFIGALYWTCWCVCMLFIKTSKCFTVHCSFTLPVGAGAVIPVSEGSDRGHCWPVGVAAHHQSTEPLRTTLQLLSSLMGSLGGESQGWWGLRYLASLPRAVYHVGRSKYAAHAVATSLTSSHTPRNHKNLCLEAD